MDTLFLWGIKRTLEIGSMIPNVDSLASVTSVGFSTVGIIRIEIGVSSNTNVSSFMKKVEMTIKRHMSCDMRLKGTETLSHFIYIYSEKEEMSFVNKEHNTNKQIQTV